MNLDKAYESWGQMSDNRELYFKTKTLFRKMWWLIPTNKPCSYYTLPVLARALQQANGAHSDKVNAASIMCHVLNFAHTAQPDDNPKPAFVYQDIIDYTGERDRGQVPVTKQTSANDGDRNLSPVTKRDGGKAAEKAAKAVVQLDPDTLKPVKVWPSCFAAQKELGIKNVQRAISRCGISGGFYWCRPGDEETFKPADKRAKNGRKKNMTVTIHGETHRITPITEEPKPLPKITFKPTDEQKELVKRVFDHDRGQVPVSQQTSENAPDRDLSPVMDVDSVLRKATQDELIAELRRRQWKGVLHITQTIEL